MKKKWIAIIGSGVLVIGLTFAGAGFAKSHNGEVRNGTIQIENQVEANFPEMAKITQDQAIMEALATVQGQILKTELEDENGFLVYGIEVVTADKTIVDVKVDAGSGKILSTEQDAKDNDEHVGFRDRDENENDHDNDSDSEN